MTRPADWPEQLAAFVEERRAMPFAWGSQDCMMFAADAVQLLIGVDILAEYRGAYATEDEGDAILAAEGGLEAILARQAEAAGLPERTPKLAQRGDLALVRISNCEMAGVVVGNAVVVTAIDGLHMVPLRMIRRAWKV